MRKRSARPLLELLEPRTVPTVYNVGPGQAYTTIGAVPWNNLQPGDTVDIHWQATPYHEKISLAASGTAAAPISIVGVPNAQGQLPVIAGDGATTSPNAPTFGYTPLQDLGVVLIAADSAHPYGYVPSYINLENLQVQGGNPGVSYTASGGGTRTYNGSAAGIWVEEGTNINIEGCTITDNGNGLFVLSRGSTATDSANILVQGNHIYGNGVAGTDQQHNVYTCANGITFQYNEFGPLRAGAGGNNLKDRSAGTVIRYNYFQDGAHLLDLVDPEDAQDYASLPSFQSTYVYGNVFLDDNSGAEQLFHFGGDSGLSDYRNGTLYFYDNTVVTRIDQSTYYRLAVFELDGSNTQTVDAFNNIFYNASQTAGASPAIYEFSEQHGNFNFGSNWVSPGWLASESQELGTSYSGTITGTNNFVVDPANNPGFANLAAGDVHLSSGSSLAVGKGQALISGTTAFPVNDQYVYHQSFQARPNVNDLGAFAFGGSTSTSAASLSVTTSTTTTTAGTALNVTVTAETSSGATATGYTGTVHFASSDLQAVLPANYTFSSADAGVHTFSVLLKTAGSDSVSATDTATSSITGSTSVTVTPAAAAIYSVTASASTVNQGAPITVTVTAKDAYGNVATGYRGTAHFASSDGQAVLPANYTFTSADNGSHAFGVTLKTTGSQTVTATDTAASSITGNTALAVSPVAASLAVNTSVTTATAGASFTVTVTAKDASGNTLTGYLGSVHFASSDGQAVLPANYTFVAGDNGSHTFSVTLKTAGSESVTVTDTSSSSVSGSASASVSAAAASSLAATSSSATTTAGSAFTVTVTAKDAYGNVATGYRGTAHFASSDGQAVLPANYTFTSADNGSHAFGVTLKTAGSQTVSAADTVSSSLTSAVSENVSPGAATSLVAGALSSSVTAGSAFNLTLTAKDVYGNVATGYRGTDQFTSTDAAAALPANYTFTSADAGVHTFSLTLNSGGSQSVTAADTANGSLSASANVTVNQALGSLSLSSSASSTTAGSSFTVTVTAKSSSGSTLTSYGGTVHFASSDGQAVLPANYTFAAADNGVHTFAITLKTAGSQSITVTDTSASVSPTTGSASVSVNPAAASTLAVSSSATTVTASTAFSVTVTAKDAFGNLATGYRGTVHFTSSDAQAKLPANYTFVSGDNAAHVFSVTLMTPGTQSVTVADTSSAAVAGTASGITVSATSTSGTDIALSGTAYRWWEMSSPTATTNQTAAPALNDGNLSASINLSGSGVDGLGSDASKAYEGAGVIWSSAQSVSQVAFKNGNFTASGDGVFDANFSLQVTTDGKTWTAASRWTLKPSYAYNSSAAGGVTYTFTGPATTALGVRLVGQVHTSNYSSWYDRAIELQAYGPGGPASGNPPTNLALAGTAYRWAGLATATTGGSAVAAPALNDGSLTGDVDLSGQAGDSPNAFEAAGILWSTSQSVSKVVFTNGSYTPGQDGVFDANFGLQFTTNGTTWVNATGWTLSAPYAYNSAAAGGVSYTFTGPTTQVLGFRVVGQVYTSPAGVNSWYDDATEVQAF